MSDTLANSYPDRPRSDHWADICAHKIVRERGPDRAADRPFVCASGVTPSGTIHIGNFREIISVELVFRALKDIGAPARFIYSWDDYDVFRKVPDNMPQKEWLGQFLRQSITRVPDVVGNASSYAKANEEELEAVLPRLGIEPEYLYQAQKYQASEYAEGIRKALKHRDIIRRQLDEHRSRPLADDWWPVSFFCGNCHRDETFCTGWDGDWMVGYSCKHCGHAEQLDLRRTGLVKLPWRIDWPMRWACERVDFEPAGKDHHSEGGSFTTAGKICKAVYGSEAPITFQYDFVRIKGLGGKISSSSGEVLSLKDVLKIYPPEMVRFLFAGTRPNSEFAISFDLDVLKIYDDFARCEQAYYEAPKDGKTAKKQAKLKRIYELSQVGKPAEQQPFSMPLRHLCNLLQIYGGVDAKALTAVREFLRQEGTPVPEHSDRRFRTWTECAWNWVQEYAPEDFCFRLREPGEAPAPDFPAGKEFLAFLPRLREYLRQQFSAGDLDRKALSNGFYDLMKEAGLDSGEVFPQVYRLLIGRDNGPRLIGFLEAVHSAIGTDALLELLQVSGDSDECFQ
ncbi:lysine--tRNA ligase [Candidatus Haliotispira prima]|uniref:Lysine--tRNA ligase n=1 Tax=Candidatus Haliotispira prima TaxID=3034016 RepID=A0ABY8MFC5_9SPIO|nr:lysine--tRNA ligase [Candidatus Haliotispira prima]